MTRTLLRPLLLVALSLGAAGAGPCEHNIPISGTPDGAGSRLDGSADGASPVTPLIPKFGPPYTGSHTDPGLNDATLCPDVDLEPNDDPGHARTVTAAQDAATVKLIKLAICPSGPGPTGGHDVDYYRVDADAGYLMAELFYDITYGDLDVGVYDASGYLLASDGTAITNGCIVASVQKNTYYVVVAGANNVDSNNYELRIRTFSNAPTCPASGQACTSSCDGTSNCPAGQYCPDSCLTCPCTGTCVAQTFVCTLGDDHTCNDDLSVSSIHGTCKAAGSGPVATSCTCSPGFAMNPSTGHCL
jgi:hypothetical protein